jgi:mRNA-degrading endonuclease RelE of RelBE toxin-antitoxin system
MTPPLEWQDWLTSSFYRVRVAPAALEKIRALPDPTQMQLHQMLSEIADIADLAAPSYEGRGWSHDHPGRMLCVGIGRVDVHYRIDEEKRTLTVEHVIAPKTDEPIGQTG